MTPPLHASSPKAFAHSECLRSSIFQPAFDPRQAHVVQDWPLCHLDGLENMLHVCFGHMITVSDPIVCCGWVVQTVQKQAWDRLLTFFEKHVKN